MEEENETKSAAIQQQSHELQDAAERETSLEQDIQVGEWTLQSTITLIISVGDLIHVARNFGKEIEFDILLVLLTTTKLKSSKILMHVVYVCQYYTRLLVIFTIILYVYIHQAAKFSNQ